MTHEEVTSAIRAPSGAVFETLKTVYESVTPTIYKFARSPAVNMWRIHFSRIPWPMIPLVLAVLASMILLIFYDESQECPTSILLWASS